MATKTDNKPAPKVEEKKVEIIKNEEQPKQEEKKTEAAPAAAVTFLPGARKVAGEEQTYSYAGSEEGMRSAANVRSCVLEFFQANPDTAFNYKQVADKLKEFDISQHKAWCATRDLEDMGDLVDGGKVNGKKAHKLAIQG